MKFEDALAAMRQGKRVRRPLWPQTQNLRLLAAGFFWETGVYAGLSSPNVLAEDWEVVPEPVKLYPFSVALEMARGDGDVRIYRQMWRRTPYYTAAFLRRSIASDPDNSLLVTHEGREPHTLGGPGDHGLSSDDFMARDWVIER